MNTSTTSHCHLAARTTARNHARFTARAFTLAFTLLTARAATRVTARLTARLTTRAVSHFAHALLALTLVGASAGTALAQDATQTPAGVWQTIDDHTQQPKALVQISEADGTLTGKVIKGLGPNDQPDRRCTACKDSRKDQLMLGMTIVTDMKADGANNWDGGQILDPENGSVYKCKMHLEDNGQKLVVRGYIGVSLIGRSQTWIRQQ